MDSPAQQNPSFNQPFSSLCRMLSECKENPCHTCTLNFVKITMAWQSHNHLQIRWMIFHRHLQVKRLPLMYELIAKDIRNPNSYYYGVVDARQWCDLIGHKWYGKLIAFEARAVSFKGISLGFKPKSFLIQRQTYATNPYPVIPKPLPPPPGYITN